MGSIQILVAYEDEEKSNALVSLLVSKGYTVITAKNYDEVLIKVKTLPVELLITDMKFSCNSSNYQYHEIKLANPMVIIIRVLLGNFKAGKMLKNDLFINSNTYEYFQKMLDIIELQDKASFFYSYKVS